MLTIATKAEECSHKKTSMETMPGSALSEKAELVIHMYKTI